MKNLIQGVLILNLFTFFGCIPKVENDFEKKVSQIKDYITANGLSAQQTAYGTYFMILDSPLGLRKPKKGETITLFMNGKYLTGGTIANFKGTYKYPAGDDKYYYDSELEDVLRFLNEGDSARVFLTHDPVVFYDFRVKSIRSETEQIEQFKTTNSYTNTTKTSSGLEYVMVTQGSGASPSLGKKVTVKYSLLDLDGKALDNSDSYTVTLNTGTILPGFIESVILLKPGGKGKFILPSSLGYGEAGKGDIKPFTPLFFIIELVSVE